MNAGRAYFTSNMRAFLFGVGLPDKYNVTYERLYVGDQITGYKVTWSCD